MPRTSRIVVPGVAHHVTQRGNRQQDIFLDDEDRRTYLRLLRRFSQQERLSVLAYCLMGNHVHLVVVPTYDQSMARAIGTTHTRYAQYMNEKHEWAGHLFASRYYSCPCDEEHQWAAMRYTELNPVRAGLVKQADQWLFSSAPAHCGRTRDPLLDTSVMSDWTPAAWRKWLRRSEPGYEETLRRATYLGRPLGSEKFVRRLQKLFQRTLAIRPPGRPRKKGTV